MIGSDSSVSSDISGFFNDLKFVEAYISKLEKFTSKDYFQKFLKSNENSLKNNLEILYKNYPLAKSKKQIFKDNQRLIKEKLNPINPLHIYKQNVNSKKIKLSIANNHIFPIEIISLHDQKGEIYYPKDNNIIVGKRLNQFPIYQENIYKD